MSTILTRERDLYDTVWSSLDAYGAFAPGEHYLPIFLDMVGETRGTVLDAGCGSGKGALALRAAGFDVRLTDLTGEGLVEDARLLPFREACLWKDLTHLYERSWRRQAIPFDYVYCCDVLEHIPVQFTLLVIDQLLRVTRQGLFLSIALVPDAFGVWAGRPLHQTVESFVWWRDNLAEVGEVAEARDLHEAAVFFVRPR